MFVDTYFKIACSFTNVNLITSTRAYVLYVRWMNVFVFEFEESFDLACLPRVCYTPWALALRNHKYNSWSMQFFNHSEDDRKIENV